LVFCFKDLLLTRELLMVQQIKNGYKEEKVTNRFVRDRNSLFRRSKVFQTRSGDRKGPKGPRGLVRGQDRLCQKLATDTVLISGTFFEKFRFHGQKNF
jgi:hypothetical protein